MAVLTRFCKDDDGLELVEYALLMALLVAAGTVAIGALAVAIVAWLANTAAKL